MNNTIVVKIEIETLSGANGKFDTRKMERLAMILSNLNNSGKKIILVSSGAIALGMEKLKLSSMPCSLVEMQATAAIGQAELIKMYQKYFGEFNQIVAQVLITKDVNENEERRRNATNTFSQLLKMNIIPVVNENDVVSTDDIVMDDNYPIAYMIAILSKASMILIKEQEDFSYSIIKRGENTIERIKEEDILRLVDDYAERVQNNLEDIAKKEFPLDITKLVDV